MWNCFADFKLKRSKIFAFFKDNDCKNAVIEYKKYKSHLCFNLVFRVFFRKHYLKEKNYLKTNMIEKLLEFYEFFLKEENFHDALFCIKEAYRLNKNNADIISKYMDILEKLEQFDLELILAKRVLKLQNSSQNYSKLSSVLEKMQDYKNAIKIYEKYIETSKKQLETGDTTKLGCLYFNLYKQDVNPEYIQKSTDYFKQTLDLTSGKNENEKNRITHIRNYISALKLSKKYSIEKVYWNLFFKLKEADADDKFTYSASCMLSGDIKGWEKYYEERFNKKSPVTLPKTKKPKWTGKENLKNSTLLIHCEQGFGDTILMWGYMPRILKFVKKIVFVMQKPLVELFSQNDMDIEVLANADINSIDFDYYISAMSIPHVLQLTKNNLSPKGGYVKIDKDSAARFKNEYFNNTSFNIGISFLGNPKGDKCRDIPPEKLKPLLKNLKNKNVKFYCLTKDINDNYLNKIFGKNKVFNIAKYFNNFKDTACAIENLDLVVTTDNCILNLAGAMDKKTLGLFNYHYNSRWYDLNENNSGWYTSVKPFVNNEYDDWDKNVKRVIKEVNKIICSSKNSCG